MLSNLRKGFKGFAQKLLAIDEPIEKTSSQFESVRELLSNDDINCTSKDLQELVLKLRKKHLVDEISIAEPNGSLIISSGRNGLKQAITGAALFQYVNTEMKDTKTIMIKTDAWTMIMPFNNKLYFVKADASLTEIELKALARDVQTFLEK